MRRAHFVVGGVPAMPFETWRKRDEQVFMHDHSSFMGITLFVCFRAWFRSIVPAKAMTSSREHKVGYFEHPRERARALIEDRAFFAGRWQAGDGGKSYAVHDPATGEMVGTAPDLSDTQIMEAIDAAEDGLKVWSGFLPAERSRILNAWCDLMMARREGLAALITLEQGKPLHESLGEIDYAASFIRWYAEETKRDGGDVLRSHLPGRRLHVNRAPIGIVAAITPWNFPSAMLARKAAAALAAGCSVIGLPSSQTPFSALALARLAEEAGFAKGVFSVVTGNSRRVVPLLCGDARVRAVSFTGSTEVGRVIAGLCAPTIKKVSLELGGHAPFIVFEDADLERAMDDAMNAKFQTTGQDCLAANRIFVQDRLYDRFVEGFVDRATRLKVGDGFASGVNIGPMIHGKALQKVHEQVEDAQRRGARLELGGQVHNAGPNFYAPTVLSNVADGMLIMHEETFGPVAGISRFATEEDAIRRANATEYGLAAYLHTRDLSRAERVSSRLEYGMVGINTSKMTGAPIPFGGVKQSGLGREGGPYGMQDFMELKYVCAAYE
ncbi:aspartate-semialdehyde dehydrogenase [Nitratireductor indicus]|nr:aspartate-semialdehyde dehydrogenase [Nitratireductor indicus]